MSTLRIVRYYGLYDVYDGDTFVIQFAFLYMAKAYIAKAGA